MLGKNFGFKSSIVLSVAIGLLMLLLFSVMNFSVAQAQADTSPNCSMEPTVVEHPNRFSLQFSCNSNPYPAYHRNLLFGDDSRVGIMFTKDGQTEPVTHDYAYVVGGIVTYTLVLQYDLDGGPDDIFVIVIDDQQVTPTPIPSQTATPMPSVTPAPTQTVVPTSTVVPTATVAPTVTVAPTSTPVATPIFQIEGIKPDCREFSSIQLQPGEVCYIPESVTVTTASDVYYTLDFDVYENEFHKNGGTFTGPAWIYAPWGASFAFEQEEETPEPDPTPTTTPTPNPTPEFDENIYLPSLQVPEPPVYIFTGIPANCSDYMTDVAPAGTICFASEGLITSSDVYLSWDQYFTEAELRTGGEKIVLSGQYVYMKWGGSFTN